MKRTTSTVQRQIGAHSSGATYFNQLWCQVLGCSGSHILGGDEAKVTQLDTPLGVDQQIMALQIAVNDGGCLGM